MLDNGELPLSYPALKPGRLHDGLPYSPKGWGNMSNKIWLKHVPHKKETAMNCSVDIKSGAKLLKDRILVSLISGLITLVGIVGFTTAKKVTDI